MVCRAASAPRNKISPDVLLMIHCVDGSDNAARLLTWVDSPLHACGSDVYRIKSAIVLPGVHSILLVNNRDSRRISPSRLSGAPPPFVV